MNKVGDEGKGESVWVAWFQIVIFDEFSKMLRGLGDDSTAGIYEEISGKLRHAVEEHAWDGQWYRRAYFDDGSPLGSHECEECQIDSLAQTWAVIANGSTPRSQQAFESAVQRLVKKDSRIVLLFDPPFNESDTNPGYIKGYLPGVRENGGQYTHAAVWMIQAATLLGKGDLAMQLFDMLNPLHHTMKREGVERYKVEPYVLAADVYGNQQHCGRGGWTWYTGSASWMYRIAIESQLGIHITKDELTIKPSVPADWTDFRFTWRRGSTTWNVHAKRRNKSDLPSSFKLIEDAGEHDIVLGFD
jgi:cyclic beta-1,2-glucan synthetase